MSLHRKSHGFTLVEVVIISPIIILMIGIFIHTLISMTGDVLSTSGSNDMIYDVQSALDQIEKDVKASGAFLATNNIPVKSPQGLNDDNTKFTNVGSGDTLILNAYATTESPDSDNAEYMYINEQPYSCNSGYITQNPKVMYNIVYFVKDNTLWRRIIVPSDYETVGCNSGSVTQTFQEPTCSPGYSDSFCKTNDEKLVENISTNGFDVSYYTEASSTSENTTAVDVTKSDDQRQAALQTTNAIHVTINADTKVAGRDVSQTGSIRAISQNNDINDSSDKLWKPLELTNNWIDYNWQYHSAGYRKTSDGMVTLTGLVKKDTSSPAAITSCSDFIGILPEGYRPPERLLFMVTSNQTYGRVDVYTDGTIEVCIGHEAWVSLDTIRFLPSNSPYAFNAFSSFQNGWTPYGSGHATPGYYIDNSGRTVVKGFVTGGTTTAGTVITSSLPSGYAPQYYSHITEHNAQSTGNLISISSSGAITAKGGPASYSLSLQAIFYPTGYTGWRNLPLDSDWITYDSGSYGVPQYTKGKDGLVSLRGLVKDGTVAWGARIGTLPEGYRPAKRLLLTTASNGASARIDITPEGEIVPATGSNLWYSLDGITFYAEEADTEGLAAEYFSNTTLTGSARRRVDKIVDFSWGQGSPISGISQDSFSVRWTGYVTAPTTGSYTFYVTSDDGQRLYLNGSLVVDNWVDQAATTKTYAISLSAGQRIAITYQMYDSSGNSSAKLEWATPGELRSVIPSSALSTD